MVSTSTTNPGILNIFKNVPKKSSSKSGGIAGIRNSGYGKSKERRTGTTNTSVITYDERRQSQKKAWNDAYKNNKKVLKKISPSQGGGGSSTGSSSGSGITDLDGAANDSGNGENGGSDGSGGSSDGSSDGSGGTSPLLEGSMTFEELVGDICNGIDLIFATKRSTVVVTDYASIYAEAKYLRSVGHKAVEGEDIGLHQLEEGTYELDVSEYGFYNTVKVHYKNGIVTESYEDLVRVYGEVKIDYYETHLDKTTAIMKAKAYLAAHIRDFDMSLKANILWNGEIDVGDIVTIENPLTMRDEYRTKTENRDPEYYFVMGKSVEWEGDTPITGTLELRYGAKSPETKEVPETGTSYTDSSDSFSGDVNQAVKEVAQEYSGYSYCHTCQTASCVKQHHCGDCYGMSDTLSCALTEKGVPNRILQYASSYAPSGTHRSVQYKDASGKWKNFPYRKYGFNSLFNDLSNANSGKRINSTCGD